MLLCQYAACFFAVYRLSRHGARLALALLLVVMAANSFWNYLYFRRRDLRLVFQYSAVYAVVVVFLLVALLRADLPAALPFVLYAAYLPYALVLFYRTWKLNR